MTDITTLAGYRANISTVFQGAPFVPENVVIGQYAFAPWVRNGLATAISGAPTGLRASVPVSFDVTAKGGGTPPIPDQTQTVSHTLTLRGPGDVLGIDQGQIIRREPAPNVALSDSTTLALIEFDRPDLPWLHSPFPANGGQLTPWIALVVVDASISTIEAGNAGLPDRLNTQLSELQPLDDAWAWAHAQVLGTVATGPSVDDRMGDAYAADNLSRLICPRQLQPNTNYIAAVVPTFNAGVQAGLGLGDGTLAAAWGSGPPGTAITLPVYTSWRFAIGDNWDFEMLAERLKPVPAPWQIGRRGVDLRAPRGGVSDDLTSAGGIQIMDCALHSPADLPTGSPTPAEWTPERTTELKKRVDVDHDDPDLPRVGPRLYARFQRGSTDVPYDGTTGAASDWFTAINLRPLDRLVAGLGTRVVQRDQDKLMQAAWAQIGEVAKANAALDRIRLSRYVAEALVAKTLNKLSLASLTAVTHQVHGKIAMPGSTATVWANIENSALPAVASSMAFRRAVTAGPVARTAIKGTSLTARAGLSSMIASPTALNDFRVAYADPAGLSPPSAAIAAGLPAAQLATLLKVTPDIAATTLVQRYGTMIRMADAIAAPRANWTIAQATATTAVTQLQAAQLATLDATAGTTLSAGRLEALGAQYAVLAVQAPSLATSIGQKLTTIDGKLGASIGTVAAPIKPVLTAAPVTPAAPVAPTTPITRSATIAQAATPLAATRVSAAGLKTAATTKATTTATTTATTATTAASAGAILAASNRFQNFGKLGTVTAGTSSTTMLTNAALADSLSAIATGIGIRQLPSTPASSAPTVSRAVLLGALDPGLAAKRAIIGRLGTLPPWLPATWFDDLRVKPIMAAPRFDRPMWGGLADYDQNWLIPNLGLIDQTDFVTMLFDNPRFTESYLVGLSDEMGRELLWRGYPTDQRGTYFYRMWSETGDDLTQQVARFPAGALGTHLAGGTDPRVVMLVRGAVVKRHPDAIFVAVQRDTATGQFASPPESGKGSIVFHASLGVDTILVGFDLVESDIENGNWWFLLAEHPSAPRFGLDVSQGGQPLGSGSSKAIDQLAWGDLPMSGSFLHASTPGARVTTPADGNFTWGAEAASVARILLQDPSRAAFEAKPLLAGAK